MNQSTGVKIRLKVSSQEGQVLDGQSKICNWLYNRLLEQANTLRTRFVASDGQDDEAALTLYSRRGLRNLIPELKGAFPFLKSVYSSPLKNAGLRLSRAIREYDKARGRRLPLSKVRGGVISLAGRIILLGPITRKR